MTVGSIVHKYERELHTKFHCNISKTCRVIIKTVLKNKSCEKWAVNIPNVWEDIKILLLHKLDLPHWPFWIPLPVAASFCIFLPPLLIPGPFCWRNGDDSHSVHSLKPGSTFQGRYQASVAPSFLLAYHHWRSW